MGKAAKCAEPRLGQSTYFVPIADPGPLSTISISACRLDDAMYWNQRLGAHFGVVH
jgi:hypothetical protein